MKEKVVWRRSNDQIQNADLLRRKHPLCQLYHSKMCTYIVEPMTYLLDNIGTTLSQLINT